MDETMSNFTWDTTASDTVTCFTSTADSSTYTFIYEEEWKPYSETKYKPKWHITLGYKIQMNQMWE